MEQYLSEIKGKRVALVVNQTSVVHNREGGRVHLLDTLLRQGFDVRKVFAPEHGLRGEEEQQYSREWTAVQGCGWSRFTVGIKSLRRSNCRT